MLRRAATPAVLISLLSLILGACSGTSASDSGLVVFDAGFPEDAAEPDAMTSADAMAADALAQDAVAEDAMPLADAEPAPDAAAADARPLDAMPVLDAGPADAMAADAMAADAMPTDALALDAMPVSPDAAASDGGLVFLDGGEPPDVGFFPDASPADSGVEPDSGSISCTGLLGTPTPCSSCVEAYCCPNLRACEASTDCTTQFAEFEACLALGGSVSGCMVYFGSPAGLSLTQCVRNHCASFCP